MSAGQNIDYDALVRGAIQEAKRSVVRTVLQQVAKSGLVGGHHFLIAFNTQAPGVSLSKRLREKYPQEMTIVLQHRFWDLEVSDDRFEVKLTFDSIPERLAIPYTAIKAFYDPSVPYMMPFDDGEVGADTLKGSEDSAGQDVHPATGQRGERRRDRTQRRPRAVEPRSTDAEAEAIAPTAPAPQPSDPAFSADARPPSKPASPTPVQPLQRPKPAAADAQQDAPPQPEEQGKGDAGGGAKVLDLSSFRKKK